MPTLLALVLLAAAPVPATPAAAGPALTVQTEAAVPGGVLVLDVRGLARGSTLRGQLLGEKLKFFPAGPHHQRALVGLSLEQAPGKVPVELQLRHGKETTALTTEARTERSAR